MTTTTDTLTAAGFNPAAVRQAALWANAGQRAARLHAIAHHIEAHPHLAPVTIERSTLMLDDNHATPLAAWARTLYGAELHVSPIRDRAGELYCTVTGRVDNGHEVTLWAVVPGLADELGIGDGHAPGVRVRVSLHALAAAANALDGQAAR